MILSRLIILNIFRGGIFYEFNNKKNAKILKRKVQDNKT